ncbi:MAG: nuclear transport factor 2 family protein [Pseudomonadota bacterium]
MIIPERVLRWQSVWEGADPDRVAALYTPGATHASAGVKARMPELGKAELHGPAQIRAYAEASFALVKNIRFEILDVTSQGGRDVVEYLRRSSIDTAGPKHVVEILEWEGDLLCAVRVFHF